MNDKEQGVKYHHPPSIKAVYCARCGAGPYAWNELRNACRECGCGDFIEKETKPSSAEEGLIYSRREIGAIIDAAERRGFEAAREQHLAPILDGTTSIKTEIPHWNYPTFEDFKKAKP